VLIAGSGEGPRRELRPFVWLRTVASGVEGARWSLPGLENAAEIDVGRNETNMAMAVEDLDR
jgi:hypothetical protein